MADPRLFAGITVTSPLKPPRKSHAEADSGDDGPGDEERAGAPGGGQDDEDHAGCQRRRADSSGGSRAEPLGWEVEQDSCPGQRHPGGH
jgi:hypothetical protein